MLKGMMMNLESTQQQQQQQPQQHSLIGSQQQQQQQYCLKWNNYAASVTSTFKSILAGEDFVDVSLVASTGHALKAHRVVLAACSAYFREILKGLSLWQHPVIVLKDVPFADLQGIVEFIYHGEVSVDQASLSSLLRSAEILKVKGLTEEDPPPFRVDEDSVKSNNSLLPPNKHHQRKRANPTQIKHVPMKSDDDEDEEEENEDGMKVDNNIHNQTQEQRDSLFSNISPTTLSMAPVEDNKSEDMEEEIDDGEDDEDRDTPPARLVNDSALSSMSLDSQLSQFFNYSKNLPLNSITQKKTCPHCFQQLSWHALSRHVRDMHRNQSNYVSCKFCHKMFRNKNSLGCHMWRFHKDMKDKEPSSGNNNNSSAPSSNLTNNSSSPIPPPIISESAKREDK